MAPGYDISSIGLSPLGTMGLGVTSPYTSYDPYMMGSYGYGGLGMGMGYNPMFGMGGYDMGSIYSQYQSYADAMNRMEENQLSHYNTMHQRMLDNEVYAAQQTDSANARKNLVAASVRADLRQLVNQIEGGHTDGICEAFSALREQVLSTYSDEFAEREGKENVYKAANRKIAELYYQETGRDIYDDIKSRCEGATINGFKQGFLSGHDKRDAQQVMNYCFGDKIANYEHEQRMKGLGYVGGRAARDGLIAGVATVGATGLIKYATPIKIKDLSKDAKGAVLTPAVQNGKVRSFFLKHFAKNDPIKGKNLHKISMTKGLKNAGKVGLAVAAVYAVYAAGAALFAWLFPNRSAA